MHGVLIIGRLDGPAVEERVEGQKISVGVGLRLDRQPSIGIAQLTCRSLGALQTLGALRALRTLLTLRTLLALRAFQALRTLSALGALRTLGTLLAL